MLKKTVLYTFLMMFLFCATAMSQESVNQVDAQGRKQGFWQKKQTDGKLVYQGNFKDDQPVGEWKRYHQNGVVKAVINYPAGSDTASVKLFDTVGNKVGEGYYAGKEKAGHWTYFEKQQLVSEDNYAHGKKNGFSRNYYPTGELFVEVNYVDGVQEGVYKACYQSGSPYFECQMKADKRDGYCQIFYPNGELETEAFYVAGLRDGDWKYYDEQGNYQYTLSYRNGLIRNQAVLDSLEQVRFDELNRNRHKIIDPEKFMNDPSTYMRESQIR